MGSASSESRSRCAAFFSSSTFISSQTNRPAWLVRAGSVKTKALIERQVCHQGAQASMKSGSFWARASARAFA